MMIMITLQQILDHKPCLPGYNRLRAVKPKLPLDEPFPLVDAIDSNPLEEVVWALRCVPNGDYLAIKFGEACRDCLADCCGVDSAYVRAASEYLEEALTTKVKWRAVETIGAACRLAQRIVGTQSHLRMVMQCLLG